MNHSSYQLIIEVSGNVTVQVGKLGKQCFPAGRYVYTGSAKRHFEARVSRHLRSEKTLRWHIDYLLAAEGVRVVDVLRSTEPECELNQATGGEIVMPGFGASDCRAGCGSHLKRLIKMVPLSSSGRTGKGSEYVLPSRKPNRV